jgi:hypothetical protein
MLLEAKFIEPVNYPT